MSASIDERVVEMRFENDQFEKGASTTMDTLSQLKKSLDFDSSSSTSAIDKIGSSLKNLDFDSITQSLSSVSDRFSTMGVIGATIISNLTNKVIDLASSIVNTLAIEPIASGFTEYEEKMDNVQTIMVNTGESVETVNSTLDDLNHYADKTIYKFSDMTSAVSKFTTVGVDLDTAKTAVQGIGNAAAEAGLKASQASSAYYMIAQAMSTGQMNLYQYRTLETTGFASMKFKKNLLETAVAMGKLQQTSEDTWATLDGETEITLDNLRTTLTETGWFDRELMEAIFSRYADANNEYNVQLGDIATEAEEAATQIKTLSQLWDTLKEAAQSGWTESWQIIVGDFEQAKSFLGDVNDIVSGFLDAGSESRNNWLTDILLGQHSGAVSSSDWIHAVDDYSNAISEAAGETDLTSKSVQAAQEVANSVKGDLFELAKTLGYVDEEATSMNFGEDWFNSDFIQEYIDTLSEGTDSLLDKLGLTEDIFDDVAQVQKGSTNDSVKTLQTFLSEWGYYTDSVDSIFGVNTQAAVKAFQEANGLVVDGVATSETWAKVMELATSGTEDYSDKLEFANDLLQESFAETGQELLHSAILSLLQNITTTLTTLKTAFTDVFGTFTGEDLASISDAISEFNNRLKMSAEDVDTAKHIFTAFFSVLDIFKQIFVAVARVVASYSESFGSIYDWAMDGVDGIADLIIGIDEYLKENDVLYNAIKKIGDFIASTIEGIISWIQDAIDWIEDFTGIDFHIPSADEAISAFTTIGNTLSTVFETISSKISGAKDGLESFLGIDLHIPSFEELATILEKIVSPITSFFSSFEDNGENEEIEKKTTLVSVLTDVIDRLWGIVKSISSSIMDTIGNVFSIITGDLMSGEGIDVAKLAAILWGIRAAFDLGDVVESLKIAFGGITNIFETFGELLVSAGDAIESFTNSIRIEAFYNVAKAVALLVASIVVLAAIDQDALSRGITALGTVMTLLVAAITAFEKLTSKQSALSKLTEEATGFKTLLSSVSDLLEASRLNQMSNAFIKFGAAVLLLSVSVAILASCGDNLWSAIGALGAIMGMIVLFEALMEVINKINTDSKKLAKPTGLIALGVAVVLMAAAVAILGAIPLNNLIQGEIALAAILVMVALMELVAAKVKGGTQMLAVAASMLIMASAMVIFAVAVAALGAIPTDMLIKGEIALAAILAMMAIMEAITAATNSGVQMIALAAAMLIMAPALIGFAAALAIIGSLSWGQILEGLVSIVAIMGIMVGLGALLLAFPTVMLGMAAVAVIMLIVAADLVVFAAGITALAAALDVLGNVPTETMTAALKNLVKVFAVLVVGGLALAVVSPVLLVVAAAMLAIALAATATMAALTAYAAALMMIGTYGEVAASAFIGGMSIVITGLEELMPEIGSLLSAVIDLIVGLAPKIASALVTVLMVTLDTLGMLAGPLAEKIVDLIALIALESALAFQEASEVLVVGGRLVLYSVIESFLQIIADLVSLIPFVGDSLSDGVLGWIDTVEEKLDPEGAAQLAEDYKQGFKDAFSSDTDGTLLGSIASFLGFSDSSAEEEAYEQGASVASSYQEGASAEMAASETSVLGSTLGVTTEDGVSDGTSYGTGVTTGLESILGSYDISSTDLLGDIDLESLGLDGGTDYLSGLTSAFQNGETESIGSYVSEGLGTGILSGESDATTAASTVSTDVLEQMGAIFEVASPSKATAEIGSYVSEGLAQGIKGGKSEVVSAASAVSKSALSAFDADYSRYYSVGRYAITGFISGMRSKIEAAASAAAEVANAAYYAVKNVLDIASPSKKFMELGKYTDQGFAKGLAIFAVDVGDAAEGVADTAVYHLNDELYNLGGLDLNPTIRPTLDLSQVTSEARKLNTMFNDNQLAAGVYASGGSGTTNNMSNTFNVNNMNEAMIDYFISRMNRSMGAMV